MEKGVEAEIASFENELSVDIDWTCADILHPSNYVEHWRVILWDKAFRVYFDNKGDLKFSKGLDLLEFDEGPIAIKRVAYRYYFLSFFLHIIFDSYPFHCHFLTPCSSLSGYIHRELDQKNALPPSALLSFLLDWINVTSNLCVYTAMHVTKFPPLHLEAGGWYLDCSRGFVPDEEESLYSSLVSSGPKVVELEEEPEKENPAPPSVEKDIAPVKGKGRGKKVLAHASSQVSTRFYIKASVQRNVAPATTVVGSPTATPSLALASPVVAPSQSGATIPSVLRKRKVVAPDTSATSSERSSSLCLIENVDMEKLIEDLMKTKVPPPAYRHIQGFLTKVCMHFHCFSLSFNFVDHLFYFLILFALFLSSWNGAFLSKHQD